MKRRIIGKVDVGMASNIYRKNVELVILNNDGMYTKVRTAKKYKVRYYQSLPNGKGKCIRKRDYIEGYLLEHYYDKPKAKVNWKELLGFILLLIAGVSFITLIHMLKSYGVTVLRFTLDYLIRLFVCMILFGFTLLTGIALSYEK